MLFSKNTKKPRPILNYLGLLLNAKSLTFFEITLTLVSFLSNNTHTTIHDTNKCNGSYFLVYEVFVLNNNKYFQKLRFRLKINSKNTSTLLAEVSYFFTIRILITFLNNLLFLVTDQKRSNLFHDVIHE